MKHYRLTLEERAFYGGYTDLFILTHEDLTEATADTRQTIDLTTGKGDGDLVKSSIIVDIKERFLGITAVHFDIGFGDDSVGTPNYFMDDQNAKSTIPIAADTSAVANSVHNTKELTITFDPMLNGENLAAVTQGELWVWAEIFPAKYRENLQA